MNDKVTLQAISDIFANQYGISKRTTEAFCKSFFDTIVDGLNKDGVVKIAGLGTFKIVEVGSRESINVTNGERIVIEGYKKVTFVPDEIIEPKKVEQEEMVETEVASAVQEATKEAVDNESDDISEECIAKVVENVLASEPDKVEVPANEFGGIDLLISTPESIQEVRQELEAARERAERTLEEAKTANIEYRRLELLLERLLKGAAPELLTKEMASTVVAADATPLVSAVSEDLPSPVVTDEPIPSPMVEDEQVVPEETPVEQGPTELALQRYLASDTTSASDDEEEYYDDDEYEEKSYKKLFIIIPLVGAILAGIVIFGYRYFKYYVPSNEPVYEEVLPANNKKELQKDTTTVAKKVDADSTSVAENKEIEKKAEKKAEEVKSEKEDAPKTPKTYVIQKGESLTRISQKFYNTKDSVSAIIRINSFADPNNVPIGSVIKLP